jgi:DMSO/TMAO reductase YedYZ molybdopterin-dependent catalytic subunit
VEDNGGMSPITRGFRRRQPALPDGVVLPPGQHLVDDFPVLSAGPTPHVPLEHWDLAVEGAVEPARSWDWHEFRALPSETATVDIHCVTSWSKLGTVWEGVSVDTLLEGLEVTGGYVSVECDGGYTTNLPLDDVTGGKAWVAYAYDGAPLEPEHGGPARLLVPHLYFWKSAKWVRRIVVTEADALGFWETLGYHRRGDPWREQRYRGD